jgi:putative membrane protein
MVISAVASFAFLSYGEHLFSGHIPLNSLSWTLAGVLIGLGVLLPGLSPSNLLVYMGMYKPMVDGFKSVDPAVVIPLALGAAACVLGLSKIMDYFFSKAYTGLFHFIVGIVLASTVMIIPFDYDYVSLGTLVCLGACIGGIVLAWWMSMLEEKYKPE